MFLTIITSKIWKMGTRTLAHIRQEEPEICFENLLDYTHKDIKAQIISSLPLSLCELFKLYLLKVECQRKIIGT